MKYKKENIAPFRFGFDGDFRFGAKRGTCRPSVSLEEYIEREMKVKAFAFVEKPMPKADYDTFKAAVLN